VPKYIHILGYDLFFWSNEGRPLEPVHIHVDKNPSEQSTKYWIHSDGTVELAHNNSKIKPHDLKKLEKIIEACAEDIVKKWEVFYGEKVRFIDGGTMDVDVDLDEYEI